MKGKIQGSGGFTLIELIIVVIILGILAALAIPQLTPSTQDAQVASLKSHLAVMRTAINLYYHQHNNTYPGLNHTDGTPADASQYEAAFIAQLTQYTNRDGQTSATKDSKFPFGPYLSSRQIPPNPLPDPATVAADDDAIEVDASTAKLTATPNATEGWRYSVATGEFIANNTNYDDL